MNSLVQTRTLVAVHTIYKNQHETVSKKRFSDDFSVYSINSKRAVS